MSNFGITPQGIVVRRLDTIMDELHTDLSEGWNVNTRINPKSYLNVQLTAFADKIAELWEVGEQIYHSMYPFSAEDMSLDNSVQYGGVTRENARPTIYPIHCECVDGTVIPRGTLIRTSTNPAIHFIAGEYAVITRSAFNRAVISVAVIQPAAIYTIALNGELFSYTSAPTDAATDILNGIAANITDEAFIVSVDAANARLSIQAADFNTTNVLTLSGNLTTASVTGIVRFHSEMNGVVPLPDGVITQIVTAVNGLIGVVNLLPFIAGRLRQTDVELRQSYIDKIFNRSSRMLESIRSAILQNVQGVTSTVGYQNDTNVTDADGRWPHSIEMIVDGGDADEIAAQIWDKKAAGIQTFGGTEVIVTGDEGEPITIRFNRPEYVYVWFQVTISLNPAEILPPNYVEAITDIIIEAMARVELGRPIIPQRLIDHLIFANVPGIGNISTETFYSTDPNQQPTAYAPGAIPITPRQRAVTDATRIEVMLGG